MKQTLGRSLVHCLVSGSVVTGAIACDGDPNQWPAPVEEATSPPDEQTGSVEQVQQASTSASWLVATGGVGLNTVTADSQIGTDANSNFAIALWVHGTRGLRIEPSTAGIPNLIGGSVYNTVTKGAAGAAIAGGGAQSHINTVTDSYGFVGGGQQNRAGNASGTTSDAAFAVVGGGNGNTASGPYSLVGGGNANTASGNFAAVGGGSTNNASGASAVIGGGDSNAASNHAATVAGGTTNTVKGDSTTIGGGASNLADGFGSTIAGGYTNQVNFSYGTVGGGINNTAGGTAFGVATVAGGSGNSAIGDYATVSGGSGNTASATGATVVGGTNNFAVGPNATALGGRSNAASGDSSVAAGVFASADAANCFVWSDGSGLTPLTCGGNSRFVARAIGGVYFYSNADTTAGVVLTPGANAWAAVSDRNAKQDFVPVNARDVLERVAAMPVSTWTYKSEPGVRHMGPMAQDFRAAFGLGTNDKSIVTVDADGVALAAVQGVNAKLDDESRAIRSRFEGEDHRLEAENKSLRDRLEAEDRRLETLQARLDKLEAASRPSAFASMGPSGSVGALAAAIGLGAVFFARRRRSA